MSISDLAIGVVLNLGMLLFFYRYLGHRGIQFAGYAVGCLVAVLFLGSKTGWVGVVLALAFWWWTGGGGDRTRKAARELGEKSKARIQKLVEQVTPQPVGSAA